MSTPKPATIAALRALLVAVALLACCCKSHNVSKPVSEHAYPAADKKPEDSRECDPAGNVSMGQGAWQYKCSQEGKWVVDEEVMRVRAKAETHRRKLYWALCSRVLTDAEMKEVERYGVHLVIEPWASYNENEKQVEFNEALLQQFRLRLSRGAK